MINKLQLLCGIVALLPVRESAAQQRGAMVYTIDSTEIMSSAARTLSEVLQARAPGLSVLRSGGVAAQGTQIRSRGTHSFYMGSEPIVVVDGLRVDAMQNATILDIGVSTSRLDDIAPEDIARIDVLPGAAAATLYGPGAAGGALVITTKRGALTGTRVGGRVQTGVAMIGASFPTNYRLEGTLTATGQPTHCVLWQVATGSCTPTRLDSSNPFEEASPFRTARTATGNAFISGGDGQIAARLGVTGDRTLGVTPDDDDGRLGLRGSIDHHVGESLVLSGSAGFTRTSAGLPVRGNSTDASNVIANGLFGPGVSDSLGGYLRLGPPSSTREKADHSTWGASARWQPVPWLTAQALYGQDHVTEHDDRTTLPSVGFPNATYQFARSDHRLTTIDLSLATSSLQVESSITTRVAAGYQQLRSELDARDSAGVGTLFGLASLGTRARMAGPWVRPQVVFADRLSLGASARWEKRAGYSAPFGTHLFKSADAAWSLGRVWRLDSLRLRAAYGEASNWSAGEPRRIGTQQGFSSPDPEFLAPAETVAEKELGLDFAFGDRAAFSVTAYRADASDIYVFLPIGGSFPPAGRPEGTLRNVGIELASDIALLRREHFHWDATVRASASRSRVGSLGNVPPFLPTPDGIFSVGDPPAAYFMQPYTFADADNNGLIDQREIQTASALRIVGSSLPSREASLLSRWRFSPTLTLSALLDYRGGQKLLNMNEVLRCRTFGNCQSVNDRSSSLADQAKALVFASGPYAEGASFVKLREVSLQYLLPSRISMLVRSPVSVTIAGRNLATWTRYSGPDPEVNARPLNVLPRIDLAQTPLPREILIRLTVGSADQK